MSPHSATKVIARAYASPTVVLLAFNWEDGKSHEDFLGFAILRSPGYSKDGKPDYLFNKIDFERLKPNQPPKGSDQAPIQKFSWWDGGIESEDRGKTFQYTITPVLGSGPGDLHLQTQAAATVQVTIPHPVENGIGTLFNRAVVSSQSFARLKNSGAGLDRLMEWLANGMPDAILEFLKPPTKIEGAIYHLTDNQWVIPALTNFGGRGSMVYDYHKKKSPKGKGDETNLPAVAKLKRPGFDFFERTRTNIMHDKFLVGFEGDQPASVLTGSANFTPEGLTIQANVIHTFQSKAMAQIYAARQELLQGDPTKAETAKHAAWETVGDIPGTQLRVFFSPEATGRRVSIDTVVKAVQHARQSVVFCMFSPTDRALLEALLKVGDQKKILFGLLNSLVDPSKPKGSQKVKDPEKALANPSPTLQVQAEVFNRSRRDHLIFAYNYFGGADTPAGFLPELKTIDVSSKSTVPAGGKVPAVHVHHKFIVIDAETNHPTIYTGSANMSKNSVSNNDENLLEIKGNLPLAQLYLAEFLRLYNHYRARALWDESHPKRPGGKRAPKPAKKSEAFILKKSRDEWAKNAYTKGTSEYNSRVELARPPQ